MSSKTKNRYLVLGMGMLMQLCSGIIYMWSVFRQAVSEHLSWDLQDASVTSSVMLASFVVGLIIGGSIQDKTGPKPVAMTGSILLGLGMLLSAFVSPAYPWLIYVTYGVIGGFGVGFVYTTTVSVVQKWFPDKRGFATGMMVGSFGFSLVLFAPLTTMLIGKMGVSKTFIMFGVIFFVICIISSLFISNPDNNAQSNTPNAALLTKKQYTTQEMLRTKDFYLLAFSMFALLPAYFILNPLFISLGTSRGLSSELAVLGVMITGLASASGRLFTSWLSDLVGRKPALYLITALTLVAALVMIGAKGVLFLVCIAVIAFCFGGSASVYAATAADIFGTKHIGLNYGCVMIGFGVSALLFPIISNMLSKQDVYTASFLLSAGSCVVALILITFLKVPKKSK